MAISLLFTFGLDYDLFNFVFTIAGLLWVIFLASGAVMASREYRYEEPSSTIVKLLRKKHPPMENAWEVAFITGVVIIISIIIIYNFTGVPEGGFSVNDVAVITLWILSAILSFAAGIVYKEQKNKNKNV